MANPTHLEIHTGKTKKVRVQAAAPTSPTPTSGEIFVDNTAGSEAIGLRDHRGWLYVSLK